MLSISIIFVLLIIFIILGRFKKNIRWIGWIVAILFNLLIAEGFAYGYLFNKVQSGNSFFLVGNQRVLDKRIVTRLFEFAYFDSRSPYSLYHPDDDLGYTVGNNKNIGRFKATNSYGMRADREYSLIPDKDVLRLATFGDSFVFCDGEVTQNSWPYFLEKALGNLEVLNFGVSGFGLGQSYLRYLKDGLQFNPDILFINYMTMTNRDRIASKELLEGRSLRNADVFRSFFWIENGILKSRTMNPVDLLNDKFREGLVYKPVGLSESDSFWSAKIFSISNVGLFLKQIFWPREAYKAMKVKDINQPDVHYMILKNLLEVAQTNDTTVFFYYRGFNNLPNYVKALIQAHVDHVVLVDDELFNQRVAKYGIEKSTLMNWTNHYNPKGNKIYAEVIASILIGREWGQGERVFTFNKDERRFENIAER